MAEGISRTHLMHAVERLESIDEGMGALKADQKAVLEAAKEQGLNPKCVRRVVALRKQDREKRLLDEAEMEVYRQAADID